MIKILGNTGAVLRVTAVMRVVRLGVVLPV
jgi:hypothetical protein